MSVLSGLRRGERFLHCAHAFSCACTTRTYAHRRDLIFVLCVGTRPHAQTSTHAINQALAATPSPKNVLNLPARPARSDGAHTAAVERVFARAVFRVGAADDDGPCMARLAIVRAHESCLTSVALRPSEWFFWAPMNRPGGSPVKRFFFTVCTWTEHDKKKPPEKKPRNGPR